MPVSPALEVQPLPRSKLLIVEDSVAVQERLKQLVMVDHDIVGVVSEGLEVVLIVGNLCPDILLLDISLPDLNGFVVARRLRDSGSSVKIIFVSQLFQRAYVTQARNIGASGFVYKSRMRTDLLPAIRAVAEGNVFFSSELP
jgi:DNA-binding NarL/FixJ family response regulator